MIKFLTNPTQRHAICQRPKLQKEIDGVNYGAVCQPSQRGRSALSLPVNRTGMPGQGDSLGKLSPTTELPGGSISSVFQLGL